ncbi:MAG: hypothetical protein JRI68_12395 [Deltaproteobacteria bacterium]|nr:hypothetical protein [Deltaproteobacteria bacterium]
MGADDRQESGAVVDATGDLDGIDRLSAARRLLRVSLVLTVVGLLVLILDGWWRPRSQLELSAQVMAGLDLDVPAWVPSGRAGRHAGAWRRAVDLRPTPRMFRLDPSVDRLLIDPRLASPVGQPPGEVAR